MNLSIWTAASPWIWLAAIWGLLAAAAGIPLLKRTRRQAVFALYLATGLLPLALSVAGYERGRPRLEEFLRLRGVAEAQAGPIRAQFLHDVATTGMLLGVPTLLLGMIGIVFRSGSGSGSTS